MIPLFNSVKELSRLSPNVDGDKIDAALEKTPPLYVSDYFEFEPFFGLGMELIPEAQTLVLDYDGTTTVVAVIDAGEAGLAYTASALLGYVPRFTILEWTFYGQSLQMRDAVICIGSTNHVEPYGSLATSVFRLSGNELTPELATSCTTIAAISKVPLLAAIAGLSSRRLLTRKQHEFGSEIHTLTRGYSHDIQ